MRNTTAQTNLYRTRFQRRRAAPLRSVLRTLLLVSVTLLHVACGGGGGSGGSGGITPMPPAGGGAGGGAGAGGNAGGAAGGGGVATTASERFCQTPIGEQRASDGSTYRLTRLAVQQIGVPVSRTSPCVVEGSVGNIRFRIVLPETWNGDVHMVGGGGFNGSIPELPVEDLISPAPAALRVASDSGHSGSSFDASWALGNEEAIRDFAEDAVHRVLVVARSVAVLRYQGESLRRSYFLGCSTGGREGLIAAQRHPTDFDGIIARAPGANATGLFVAAQRVQRALTRPGAAFTMEQLVALETATLAHCDAADGVEDGNIDNYHCTYDPTPLRCADDNAPDGNCLTAANLAVLQAIHDDAALDFVQADGLTAVAGFGYGRESDLLTYRAWFLGEPRVEAFRQPLGLQAVSGFVRYFIADEPNADPLTLDLAGYATRLAQRSRQLDATNPDLSAFAARGGKLILWHGSNDYAVPLRETARYYDAVRAAQPAPGSTSRPAADTFLRFYVAPLVSHCGGGPGDHEEPDKLFAALRAWVTTNEPPPDKLTHRVVVDSESGATASATWCTYPAYPAMPTEDSPANGERICRTPVTD